MPANVVHSSRDEEKWEKAKSIAAKQGKAGNYAYIMGIYKRMKPSHKFKSDKKQRVLEKLSARSASMPSTPAEVTKPPKAAITKPSKADPYKIPKVPTDRAPKVNPESLTRAWLRRQGSNSLKRVPTAPPMPSAVFKLPPTPDQIPKPPRVAGTSTQAPGIRGPNRPKDFSNFLKNNPIAKAPGGVQLPGSRQIS